jgi:integrase
MGKLIRVHTLTRKHFADYYAALVSKALAPTTINDKFDYLIGWMTYLQASGEYPNGDNPARGHASVGKHERNRRAKQYGWQKFTTDQISQMFDPTNFAQLKNSADRWLPLILLYTGARANEVAHLELPDLREEDGVKVFDFNLHGDHKRLKNEASDRLTPIHPDLIALGLWERAERLRAEGKVKLFPDLAFTIQNGPAAASGSAFSRYLAKLAIVARGSGIVGHHSFRDTVKSRLKVAHVEAEIRDYYTGHELDRRPEHREAYEDDFLPSALAQDCHPALAWGLDLPGLRTVLDSPEKAKPRVRVSRSRRERRTTR